MVPSVLQLVSWAWQGNHPSMRNYLPVNIGSIVMRVIKTPYGMCVSWTKAMAEIQKLLVEQRNKPVSLRNGSVGERHVEIKRALINWSDHVMHWESMRVLKLLRGLLPPQPILTLGETHSLDFVACHSSQLHSYFVYLDFTFKHIVICLLHIFGWDNVSHLCWQKLSSLFFASRWIYGITMAGCPVWPESLAGKTALTKNNTPHNPLKKKKEERKGKKKKKKKYYW